MSSDAQMKFFTSRIVTAPTAALSYGFFVIAPRMNSSCVGDFTRRNGTETDPPARSSRGSNTRASAASACPAGIRGTREARGWEARGWEARGGSARESVPKTYSPKTYSPKSSPDEPLFPDEPPDEPSPPSGKAVSYTHLTLPTKRIV